MKIWTYFVGMLKPLLMIVDVALLTQVNEKVAYFNPPIVETVNGAAGDVTSVTGAA
jgi:hypothetical protein